MASASPSQTVSPNSSPKKSNKRTRTSSISQDAIPADSKISSTATASDLRTLLAESIASLDSAIARGGKNGDRHAIKLVSTTSSGQMLSVLLETNRQLEMDKMDMRREIEGLRERVRALEEELKALKSCEGENRVEKTAIGDFNFEEANGCAKLDEGEKAIVIMNGEELDH